MSRIIAALFLSSILLGAQTKKVVVSNRTPEVIADWQSASDKIRLVPVTNETVMAEIVDADAYIGNITPAMVRAGKNLKWTQTTSAGVERVLHLTGSTALRDSDIILTNNQIVQGPEIADHAHGKPGRSGRLTRLVRARDREARLRYCPAPRPPGPDDGPRAAPPAAPRARARAPSSGA